MCWTSDTNPIPKTADKDIICYKIFSIEDIKYKVKKFLGITFRKESIKELYSLYKEYKYIPYAANPKVTINYRKYNGIYSWWSIDKGYHSYSTLDQAELKRIPKLELIVECVIPKGSIYYLNENNEIVSSDIIITDKVIN